MYAYARMYLNNILCDLIANRYKGKRARTSKNIVFVDDVMGAAAAAAA